MKNKIVSIYTNSKVTKVDGCKHKVLFIVHETLDNLIFFCQSTEYRYKITTQLGLGNFFLSYKQILRLYNVLIFNSIWEVL